ncbi:Fructose-bisphosphate aldolase class 1 [Seminavis robusta]|uniref:fructose-bisphosphate aldolase n=1 Tax=Seminavis robusta TaxID=568900 RepID=A0A9N8F091_9STRA|nr:Fructose-bisphosphate aldolase class 1 [Seminavis robusta]|eukprot:Sro2821_g337940.1 Fructose-bisphosphate aldolase class 1 (332) ;mRNA; f:9696-10691
MKGSSAIFTLDRTFLTIIILLRLFALSSVEANNMGAFEEQMERMSKADGFLAALDQSGGSTPKALAAYGVPDSEYTAGEESMYEKVHEMRSRIMTSKCFNGDYVLGAILFENTMDRQVEGKSTAAYLWEVKNVVPFLKCDKGLADEENGVQLMKPMPGLDDLLKRAKEGGIFGTKMRSVIKMDNEAGIKAIVEQQFEVGKQIISHGLLPIIEPEVDINSPKKKECEEILMACILEQLDKLGEDQKVMLKLSLPTVENHYKECMNHPNCVRVVALSGGYCRDEANKILAKQSGMIASFSRALMEGVQYGMSDDDYENTLNASIQSIADASKA